MTFVHKIEWAIFDEDDLILLLNSLSLPHHFVQNWETVNSDNIIFKRQEN